MDDKEKVKALFEKLNALENKLKCLEDILTDELIDNLEDDPTPPYPSYYSSSSLDIMINTAAIILS